MPLYFLRMLPRLYAILDLGLLPTFDALRACALELAGAGVTLMQYRAKNVSPRDMLAHARELRRILPPDVRLIMNDRADLCVAAGLDGVHVGQDDLSPLGARTVVGEGKIVGVSTHNVDQVRLADAVPVDYIAVGPVFATSTKLNPDPVIGLEGVRSARALTTKPLVAIGGITRANCRSVLDAGADSVAVISDLLNSPAHSAETFLHILL